MFVIFAICLIAAATASPEGKCPDLQPVQNFNLTAYQGVWYEIAKLPTVFQNGKCGSAEYTVDGDELKVKNADVLNGVQNYIEGVGKFAEGANGAAKFVVTFKFNGDITTNSGLTILTTDYHNYAIAYNCVYDETNNTHKDSLWVESRNKSLEGEAKTAVDAFLKELSASVDISPLVYTDFSEEACKFTSSSVIADRPGQ